MSQNINLEQLKEKGFLTINKFLDEDKINKIDNEIGNISSYNINKGDKRGYYPVKIKAKLIKLLKFDFKSIQTSFVLEEIGEKLGLKKIAEDFFNSKVKLHMIDSYYSPISNKNVIDWHSDMAFTENNRSNYNIKDASLKFFFYLTDVQSQNGCLAYVPYSNFVTKSVAQLIVEKKIQPTPYWNLADLRKLVMNKVIRNLISNMIGEEKLNIFIENTKFIEEESKDTKKFDLEMEKGGVVIFDEFGIHRGAMPSKSARQVLRYFYRKK